MTHFPRRGLMSPVEGGGWRASNAVLTGDVTLHARASVWFGCVLRGDDAPLVVGEESNVQDLTMVHADPDVPNVIGVRTTVGHRCVLHGARIGDRCLIGMGAILLGGSVIGDECIVAAGAVVKEGAVLPPRSLVAGVPARVVKEVSDEQVAAILRSAAGYVKKVEQYLAGPLEQSR
jgi:carbonic anhydrase/acetyltransferase-like protein (isoleucine patch superfamily)